MARILVIDDDDMLRKILADFLTDAGHSVIDGGDSTAVMRLAGEHAPDLAILDYLMPHMTGTDVLAELRANAATRDLPVIFLSGTEIIRFSSKVPPDPRVRFMSKPFDFARIRDAVSELLSSSDQ